MANVERSSLVDSRSGFCKENSTFYSKRNPISLPASPSLDVTTFISCQTHRGTTAFIDAATGQRLSFSDLWRAVDRVAECLYSEVGLRRGDVILILSPNSFYIPIVCLAIMSLGAVVTTANTLSTAGETSKQIADSNPTLAFTTVQLAPKLPAGISIVLTEEEHVEPTCGVRVVGVLSEMMKKEPSGQRVRDRVNQEDTAVMLYSSGTTGASKGVISSHRNLTSYVAKMVAKESLEDEIFICTIPMFHTFGLLMFAMATVALGSTVVILRRFELSDMLAAVEKYRATALILAPPVLVVMTNEGDIIKAKYDLSSLKKVTCGGAPLSKEVTEGFLKIYPTVHVLQAYALTESNGGGAYMDMVDSRRYGTVGTLTPDVEARVVDPITGRLMGTNQTGELWLKGPSISKGFKMDKLDFPQRLYSVGQEPFPNKSIAYYSNDSKLFPALKEALEADEWEELKNSRVGVFLKFHEMKFGWASRLVHYILCFQLDCKKKFELWSLVGVEPLRFSLHEFEEITGLNCEYVKNLENPLVEVTADMKAFWAQMGVNFDRGPSIDELTAACQMCRTWSRDDRLRLGYLAIYAGFIEARRTSSPTRASLARLVMDLDAFEDYPWGRVAFKFLMESVKGVDLTKTYAIEGFVQVLQVWVYCCLPEFGAGYGLPIEGSPTPPLLAFLGAKGQRRLQENILKQTRTKNFAMKDYSEMFPRWDGELEDEKADNIVKAMFSSGWAWEQSHWPLVGTKLWTNVKVEIHPMKTEAGQMMRSLKTVSPSRTESDAESRKKARESPGLDVETMKGEIVRWLTGLTSNMVEGLSRCENTLKTQSHMIEGLTTQVGAVEKMVREGWKEDHTKAGSSTDVPEANKSDGDKAKKDSAEGSKGDESKGDESKGDESKGEESRAEESRAEESKAAETAPKGMTTRAKARDTQATVVSTKTSPKPLDPKRGKKSVKKK